MCGHPRCRYRYGLFGGCRSAVPEGTELTGIVDVSGVPKGRTVGPTFVTGEFRP